MPFQPDRRPPMSLSELWEALERICGPTWERIAAQEAEEAAKAKVAETEKLKERAAGGKSLRDRILNPPVTMTSAEAAEYTGFTQGHLANLRYRRQGPPFIPGRPVRYRKDDLDAWLARQVVETSD